MVACKRSCPCIHPSALEQLRHTPITCLPTLSEGLAEQASFPFTPPISKPVTSPTRPWVISAKLLHVNSMRSLQSLQRKLDLVCSMADLGPSQHSMRCLQVISAELLHSDLPM